MSPPIPARLRRLMTVEFLHSWQFLRRLGSLFSFQVTHYPSLRITARPRMILLDGMGTHPFSAHAGRMLNPTFPQVPSIVTMMSVPAAAPSGLGEKVGLLKFAGFSPQF